MPRRVQCKRGSDFLTVGPLGAGGTSLLLGVLRTWHRWPFLPPDKYRPEEGARQCRLSYPSPRSCWSTPLSSGRNAARTRRACDLSFPQLFKSKAPSPNPFGPRRTNPARISRDPRPCPRPLCSCFFCLLRVVPAVAWAATAGADLQAPAR